VSAATDLRAYILADAAVAARLEGATGTIGSIAYAKCRVEDQFDDYTPRAIDADEPLHECAMYVELIH